MNKILSLKIGIYYIKPLLQFVILFVCDSKPISTSNSFVFGVEIDFPDPRI